MEIPEDVEEEKQNLIEVRDLLLTDAKEFIDLRKSRGDEELRRAAGKMATLLKKAAQEINKLINSAQILLEDVSWSLNLRRKIALYHYDNWREVDNKALYPAPVMMKLSGANYYKVDQTKYNAEILAFLQNIHALCDSLPYFLILYLRPYDFGKIKQKEIGWNNYTKGELEKAAKSSNKTELIEKFNNFDANDVFKALKDIVNCAKHKHLIPIEYDGKKVMFKGMDKKHGLLRSLCVKTFMEKAHDDLLPLVLEMLALASPDAPKASTNQANQT